MTLPDLIFVLLVLGLPIVISIRLFSSAPDERPFFATYLLAVMGSSILFVISSFVLALANIGGLGPFDGIFEFVVSVPITFIVGLIVRHKRRSSAL